MNSSRLRLSFGVGSGQIELRSGPVLRANRRPSRFRPPRRRGGMTIAEHHEIVKLARETHLRIEHEREMSLELQRVWEIDPRMIALAKSVSNPSV